MYDHRVAKGGCDAVSRMNFDKLHVSHICVLLATFTNGFYHKFMNHACLLVAFSVSHTNF